MLTVVALLMRSCYSYKAHNAIAYSSAILNESIPQSLRALNAPLYTSYLAAPDDMYVLVDISDASNFDRVVLLDHVSEVIDHHPNSEAYWAARIDNDAHIEFIGAACTLIYERWVQSGKFKQLSYA